MGKVARTPFDPRLHRRRGDRHRRPLLDLPTVHPEAGADRGRLSKRGLPASRAIALGFVQGPAELLPVSSSAHIVLVPWLLGWDWDAVDPEVRKSFEVALHTGAAAALLVGQRRLIAEELRHFSARRPLLLAPSSAPAAFVGYVWERPIERHLGGPRATAYGLLAGAAAMLAADTRPQRRGRGDAGAADGLALGPAA